MEPVDGIQNAGEVIEPRRPRIEHRRQGGSMKINLALAATANLLATVVAAQDLPTYVHAGQLVDVVAGEIVDDQTIVILGDRIEAIVPTADVVVPSGATLVDLSDATVLPGLIDAHVHLTNSEQMQGYRRLERSAIRAALFGANAANRTLEAGFTTVRNLGARQFGDIALRDAIDDGDIPGPRMLASGPPLGITGGHCDSNLLPPEFQERADGVADGPWEVRQQVRENVKYGADVIKFCATGGVLSKGTTLGARQYTGEEMQAIVDEAHTLGLKVAAHAHGIEGIKAAILAGVDSVEHASILDEDAINLAVERGTVFVMDVYVSDFILESGEKTGILPESLAKEREVGQLQRDSFRQAHEAGVPMAFGSDAGVYPHGLNGRQLAYMVRYGMSPMEAIQAATLRAAELLGWSDRVGALSTGYFADLIAVAGDPIEDVRLLENVVFVMKGGEIFVQED